MAKKLLLSLRSGRGCGEDRWRRVMRPSAGRFFLNAIICVIPLIFSVSTLIAQDAHFHNAPTSSNQLKNPYAGQQVAVSAGAKLYATNCGSCHGIQGRGTGNIPPLAHGPTQVATDGEVFWFITTGSVNNGMPSWAALPERQRWQFCLSLKPPKTPPSAPSSASASADVNPVKTNAPPPQPPYADFRYEQPGKVRKITVQDFPAPYVTESAS